MSQEVGVGVKLWVEMGRNLTDLCHMQSLWYGNQSVGDELCKNPVIYGYDR